ncbi:MAG: glycerol-3-phosphate acyltransferase [Clostridia bacterium]|nr:glycerol-3-phosphate acyltransferase [Clostridia bacterium]
MFYLYLCICCVLSYLCGGVNAAIIMARLCHGEDIREKGSGNPGFTNYKRVYGNGFVTWLVLILDILKTVVPVLASGLVLEAFFPGTRQFVFALTGLCCMLGHCFPVWYRFRGGKAFIACFATVMLVDWKCGLVFLCLFLTLLFTVKYMSLCSCCAAFSYPLSYAALSLALGGFDWRILVAAILSATLVILRHYPNFVRLRAGQETKFSLFGKT